MGYYWFYIPEKSINNAATKKQIKPICTAIGSAFASIALGNVKLLEEWVDERKVIGLKHYGYHGIELKPIHNKPLRLVIAVKNNIGNNKLNWSENKYNDHILTWIKSNKVCVFLPKGHYRFQLDYSCENKTYMGFIKGKFNGQISGKVDGIVHGPFNGTIGTTKKKWSNERVMKSNKLDKVVGKLEGTLNGYVNITATGYFDKAKMWEWVLLTGYQDQDSFKDTFANEYNPS